MKTKEIVLGGLLTGLALVIPLAFGGVLGIVIPPFSATLASHVPMMIAMIVSPGVAVMVGIGSALGFLIKLGMPAIAARAFMHTFVGYAGAKMVQKGRPLYSALIWTLPLHALLEAIIVLPFGFTLYQGLVGVGIGTALHHAIDSVITLGILVLPIAKPLGLSSRVR
ncbi:ECF transporter S component [Calderihabitans maritimus]|uniref:ECF transporter S component n=1 Tax=Calderihabitans maritimus TaxID=1246530 RepID=A0A1Z5HSB7_9FIRM|nr:ECF transporter S component [Calderihabitans maritimus]GAW92221.1 hypothetical protein Thewi_0595 [Calderihabitans maritimus]